MQEGKRLEQNFMCAVTGPWVTKKSQIPLNIRTYQKIFHLIDGDVINLINVFDFDRKIYLVQSYLTFILN